MLARDISGVPPTHEHLGIHCVICNYMNVKSFFTPRTLYRFHYIGTLSPSSFERCFPRSLFQWPPKCRGPPKEGSPGLRIDTLTAVA
jgi:hypothetical protein